MSGAAPLFSICIPTFNRKELLYHAIRSALHQTYTNIEVVVSDNASDDESAEMVQGINDERIRYFRNDSNLGVAANWERCVHLAKGKFFSWLQDDDLLLPHFVSSAVAALSSTKAACCFGACLQTCTPFSLAEASVFTTFMPVNWSDIRPIPLKLSLALPLAVFESSGIPPAMAFATQAIRHILDKVIYTSYPLYAERMPIVLCAAMGGVVVTPIVGGIYRSHPDQYSRHMLRDSAEKQRQFQSFVRTLDEIRGSHAVTLTDFRNLLKGLPDQVVERLFFAHRGITATSPLFLETRESVETEYRARGISAAKHRIWRICRDATPPFLTRTFDTAIQRLTRYLRVGSNAS